MQRVTDKRRLTDRWTVTVQPRPEVDETHDDEEFRTGAVNDAVVIHDDNGTRYELILNTTGTTEVERLVSLTITTRQGIGRELLTAVPLATLQAVAEQAVLQVSKADGDGLPRWEARLAGHMGAGEVRDRTPTPEEFAAAWNSIPARLIGPDSGESITRREQLADSFGVTPWAIDKWSRRARDLGLIAKQRPGRPRTTTTKEES